MRLPSPYRSESETVAHRLAALSGALDWAIASAPARPWVQAVRDNPQIGRASCRERVCVPV